MPQARQARALPVADDDQVGMLLLGDLHQVVGDAPEPADEPRGDRAGDRRQARGALAPEGLLHVGMPRSDRDPGALRAARAGQAADASGLTGSGQAVAAGQAGSGQAAAAAGPGLANQVGTITGPAQSNQAVAAVSASRPLKLYQPVQQRHYLIAAALVCHMPGLPDRAVDPGRSERAGFVLRLRSSVQFCVRVSSRWRRRLSPQVGQFR